MVKIDAARDYYADLELTTECSTEDVKKQFRKLALKYHPDRNPGKELEYNPLFQAIQAAHEVLVDPDQRTKYDSSRRRGNVNNTFGRPTPPRRNPHYQTTSDFPPPPRRANPNPGTAGSGADRYANFGASRPRTEKPSSAGRDAKDRADMFNAWQHMNNSNKQQVPRNPGYPPQAPGSAESSRRRPPSTFAADDTSSRRSYGVNDDPTQRSAWDAWDEMKRNQPGLNRTASARAQKRGGFDPSTPSGDEAQARAHTTFDRAHPPHFTPTTFPPQVPARGPAPTARKPDPLNQFRSRPGVEIPFVEGAREPTPYMAHSGEKTYFSADAIRRSASTRGSPKLQQVDEQNDRTEPPRSKTANRSSASPLQQTPATNGTTSNNQQAGGPSRPFVIYSSSGESDEGSSSGPSSSESASQTRPKAQPSATWAQRKGESPIGMKQGAEEQQPGKEERVGSDGDRDQPRPTIFTFPIEPDTFANTSVPEMRSRSSDHVDTNFSAGNGPVPFSGNSATSNEIPRRASQPNVIPVRGRVPSRFEQPSPNDIPEMPPPPPPPPPPLSAGDVPVSSPGSTFSADHWAKNLQEVNWASRWANVPPPPPGTSPTRAPANSRRPRGGGPRTGSSGTVRTPGTPHPASVEEEEAGDPSSFTGSDIGGRPTSRDSNAMDIDPVPPSQQDNGPPAANQDFIQQSPHQQPRHVFVEPARPEWQSRAMNGDRRASVPDNLPPPPPMPPPPMPPPPTTRPPANISMKDFRQVPPFQNTSTGSGLHDLSDVSSNLPFQSQASSSHADKPPSRFNRIELPKPPKSPLPPERLTQASWAYYLGQMTAYMTAWNGFDAQMAANSQSRASQYAEMEKGPAGGMVDGWLGAVGETGALGGWDTYVRALKEDQKVKMHWQVACERHWDAVQRHGRLREQLMRNGLAQ